MEMSNMSSSELFNLTWNDFQNTLSSAVGSLLEDSDFVDVTLACHGQSFTAHKVVLSACSPYFKKLLKRNPCKHPIIILKDVNSSILNSLIRFIYHGAADVPHDQLDEFLRTAQSLEIRGLAENEDSKNTSAPPPPKRQRISLPVSSSSPTHETRPRSSLSNFPFDRPKQSSNSLSYISVEKAKALVQGAASESSSTGNLNYIPSEKARSLLSNPKQRPRTNEEALSRLQSTELSVYKSGQGRSDDQAMGLHEDSGSGFESERETSEAINVKQECSEDDIQIVDSDPYTKDEPPHEDSMSNQMPDDASGAGTSMMEGSMDDSQLYGQFQDNTEGAWKKLKSSSATCPVCHKTFSTVNNMKLHIQNIHEEKPLDEYEECYICKARLKTRQYLVQHLNSKHRVFKKKYTGYGWKGEQEAHVFKENTSWKDESFTEKM